MNYSGIVLCDDCDKNLGVIFLVLKRTAETESSKIADIDSDSLAPAGSYLIKHLKEKGCSGSFTAGRLGTIGIKHPKSGNLFTGVVLIYDREFLTQILQEPLAESRLPITARK